MNETATLNITQLKQIVNNSIHRYNDFLSGEIRTIGLRAKVINRIETLNKIKIILSEHQDLKKLEDTCAGCGEYLENNSITCYCNNCI